MRRDIWRYLSPASSIEEEVAQASALFRIPLVQVRGLARVQFVVSDEVGALLEEVPDLLRRLNSSSTTHVEETHGRLRGNVLWSQTFSARARTGVPHAYVTAPARRSHDLPENRLLRYMLDEVVASARSTGWSADVGGEIGRLVHERRGSAERWSGSRLLLDIPSRPPSTRERTRLASRRRRRTYHAVLDAYALHQSLVRRLDRDALRRSVERGAVLVADPAVLLELLCTFRVLQALETLGWRVEPFGLRRVGELRLTATMDASTLRVYYQHTPTYMRGRSAYKSIQQAHGIAFPGALRPDLTLRLTQPNSPTRWVFVEVKGGERAVKAMARHAAQDLLAYRRAFDSLFARSAQTPYGIGVVWGEGLVPRDAEVTLCTPELANLASALAATLSGDGR